MAKYSLDDLYRDAIRSQYFKNDSEGALKKMQKLNDTLSSGAVEESPLMFRVPCRIAVAEGNISHARATAEAGLLFFPDDPDLILILAICEIEQSRNQQAMKLVDEAIKVIGTNDQEYLSIAYLMSGDIWGKERKFQFQVEEYKSALKHCEKFPLAYELLGHTYLEMGAFGKARDSFKHAISAGIPMPWSMLGLGIACKNLGDMRSAITEFYRIIDTSTDPKILFRAYRNLASCHYRKRELSEARGFYAKALEFYKRDIATLCDLSIVCMENGEYADASDFLAMALKMAKSSLPSSREVITKGIAQLSSVSSSDQARRFHSNLVISKDSEITGLAYMYVGMIFESQEKFRDAMLLFERASEIFAKISSPFEQETKRRMQEMDANLNGLLQSTTEQDTSQKRTAPNRRQYVNFSRYRRFSYRR